MNDKIDEIRDRHSKRSENDLHGCYRLDGYTYQMTMKQSQLDLATALAEVDRQRAEVERLREALTDMLNGWRYIRETYGDLAGIGWDRAEQKAREALEGEA